MPATAHRAALAADRLATCTAGISSVRAKPCKGASIDAKPAVSKADSHRAPGKKRAGIVPLWEPAEEQAGTSQQCAREGTLAVDHSLAR